jgi:hypothetical protein
MLTNFEDNWRCHVARSGAGGELMLGVPNVPQIATRVLALHDRVEHNG